MSGQVNGTAGGIRPGISRREGATEPPDADIAALPEGYREKLLAATAEQAEGKR